MSSVGTPHENHIPRGMVKNLEWRKSVHEKVKEDPDYAQVIMKACRNDPIFFLSGFGVTFDPRLEPFPKVPFILYDFQEKAVMDLINCIGKEDLLIEKSRDMGASWICMSAFFWRWMFMPMQSLLMVSRNEKYVDDPGNPKALFWKLDFLLDNLPWWMKPQGYNKGEHRMKLKITNPENGSVINGESTNQDVARGDRRGAIMLDEFAAVKEGRKVLEATQSATNCRIFNSTPQGVGNSFYDMTLKDIKKIRLHWSVHPEKNRGMYTSDDSGNLKVLSPEFYPEGYNPILDGKLRSPWYDLECRRAPTPQLIAQELDISYLGSGFQFFKSEDITKFTREYARPPACRGELLHDGLTGEPMEFNEAEEGAFKLWFLPGKDGKPYHDDQFDPMRESEDNRITKSGFVVGVDVSAGTGSSNSCISVWDCKTCEKVAEFASPYIRPEALAVQAVAICRWFWGARIAWESNGPGSQFGGKLLDLGYGNVFYRRREEAVTKDITKQPGWHASQLTKLALLGSYRAAIESNNAVNRSEEAMNEAMEYVYLPGGGVGHARAEAKADPTGASANHGDRVIADALAFMLIEEKKIVRAPTEEKPQAPVGSLKWRMEQKAKKNLPGNRELDSSWD